MYRFATVDDSISIADKKEPFGIGIVNHPRIKADRHGTDASEEPGPSVHGLGEQILARRLIKNGNVDIRHTYKVRRPDSKVWIWRCESRESLPWKR